MNGKKILLFAAPLLMTAAMLSPLRAGAEIVIDPLFEYPVAPDSISTLQGKSDWVVEHFWDKMYFTGKNAVDQNALNHAMQVYITPIQFADPAVSEKSVGKLTERVAKSPVLSLQFAKAAEENLYGPRSEVWGDALYLKMLEPLLANKKVKKERKARYERQARILRNTMVGAVPPEFDYTMADGKKAHYHPNGVITVIEFGDPDCEECSYAKLKMDTDIRFSQLVERGVVNVVFINVDPEEGWQEKLRSYPEKWHVGASDEVSDLYDLRATPSLYVVDKEGKVAAKNVTVEQAIAIAEAIAAGEK